MVIIKNKGYTLIEVLISIVIFGILLSSVVSAYTYSFRLFRNCDTKTSMQLFSKIMLSYYRRMDNSQIEQVYDTGIKNDTGLTGNFIFFSDKDELIYELDKIVFNRIIDSGSFVECKLQNSHKRFTAFCGFKKISTGPGGFTTLIFVIRIIENDSISLNGVENEREFILSK